MRDQMAGNEQAHQYGTFSSELNKSVNRSLLIAPWRARTTR
jgi:hypothetical protein